MIPRSRIIVLGGGRVGSAIARDLAAEGEFTVTVADLDPVALGRLASHPGIRTLSADLGDSQALGSLVAGFDLAIGAVPGWMGYETLRTVIDAGVCVVDISFFEEDPFRLDSLARMRGVTAVVDCGVAPGLSNMVLGRQERCFERIDRFVCMVGGLPQRPVPPWNYKAPYSPCDVLEMYTRPARLRRDGEEVTMPALTEQEFLEFPGVGELEAFNTDGLRTLLRTTRVPDLVEKTLRYPGHRDQVDLLRQSGFFRRQPCGTGASAVSPLEVASALLQEQWQQSEDDHDLTVMRLVIEGQFAGRSQRLTFDLLDRYDREKSISSMARTTGYPCAAVARLVATGEYSRTGVSPPEYLGREKAVYDSVMRALEVRGITLEVHAEECSPAL